MQIDSGDSAGNISVGSVPLSADAALSSCDPTLVPWFSLDGRSVPTKVSKVYDGDSYHLVMRWPGARPASGEADDRDNDHPLCRIKCRLSGVDTPELRGADELEKQVAREARDYVKSLIYDRVVTCRCGGWDKYGRLLVTIGLPEAVDGCLDLGQVLINRKLGVAYDGGKRTPFRQWWSETYIKP